MNVDIINCRCNFSLDDEIKIKNILQNIVKAIKVNVEKTMVKKFKPHGLTIVLSLSESHLSYHSWPEFNTAFIDIFTCGKTSPLKDLPIIKGEFKPEKIKKILMTRNVK